MTSLIVEPEVSAEKGVIPEEISGGGELKEFDAADFDFTEFDT